MAGGEARDFRFLYRQGEGAIDAALWARASFGPVGIAIVLTLIALWVTPDKPRDLATETFLSLDAALEHAYLIAYAFALLICAVAEYFVSAKRFNDRGMPAAFAGLAPFSLLLAGAANWFQPRSEGAMPAWLTLVFDAVALAVIAWNVVELGFGASVPPAKAA